MHLKVLAEFYNLHWHDKLRSSSEAAVEEESESLNLRLHFFGLWQIKRFNNTLMASKIMNQTCRVAKKNKGRWICTKNTLLRHNLFDVLVLVEEQQETCCTIHWNWTANEDRCWLAEKQIRAPSKYWSGWGVLWSMERCEGGQDPVAAYKKGEAGSWYFPLLCDKTSSQT